jgi:hypothetical protein
LRDHLKDPDAAAEAFTDHQRLKPDGLHGAEVAAWLRERRDQQSTPPTASSEPLLDKPGPSGAALSADPSYLPAAPIEATP